jgi:hypothetical protein
MSRRFGSLRPVVLGVDHVSFWKHAPMQNAGNQNTSGSLAVEDDVPADLHTTQAGANIIASPTQRWVVSQHLAARLQIAEVADGSVLTPGARSMGADAQEVGFGTARETKRGHG